MAYIKRRGRTKRIVLTIIGIFILMVGTGAIGYFMCEHFIAQKLRATVSQQSDLITSNTRVVYIATSAIKSGERITKDKVITTEMLLSDNQYLQIEDLEAVALVDIPLGIPITKSMITKDAITNDTREVEFTSVTLMANLMEHNMVDIRILYPNGEDYLILSKKKIRNLSLTSNLFYAWITEEEIQRMSSAIVDAYLQTGSKIYATKYIEPALQQESIPTYLVRQEVIDVISNNPNIVSVAQSTLSKIARESLDLRLSSMDDGDRSNISSNLHQEESLRNEAIQEADTSVTVDSTIQTTQDAVINPETGIATME